MGLKRSTIIVALPTISLLMTALVGSIRAQTGLGTVNWVNAQVLSQLNQASRIYQEYFDHWPPGRETELRRSSMAARDGFMREHAIVKYRLQKHFNDVPPGSAKTAP